MRRKQYLIGGLAVAVASLALTAPAAQAEPATGMLPVGTAVADGRAVHVGPDGTIDAVAQSGDVVRSLPVGTAVADDQVVRVSPSGTLETAAQPDAIVRTLPVGTAFADDLGIRVGATGAIEPLGRSVPATIVVAPSGLDWTDAGIGAGMALGLMLLCGGLLLVTRRHRQPTAPAH
jgi:hypothetical protein